MKKNDNPIISVIVPVFNSEKYIDECIESICVQSYSNLEIILVDDSSTDGSGRKIDEWAAKDKRIIVIHKRTNEGLNMTRKKGFDVSNGEYVTFIDSDDLFYQDNIKNSLKAMQDSGADVVIYGYREIRDEETKVVSQVSKIKYDIKELSTKSQIADYAFFGDGNFAGVQYMTVWGKLYAREVIERVNWSISNYRSYEDNFWTPQVLLASNKIVIISVPLIYYRRNIAYGISGNNLGNRLTGNSIEGKDVGYLEYLSLLQEFYCSLARDNGFKSKLDKKIHQFIFISKMWRIDNLVAAGLLDSENNLQFIFQDLSKYIEEKNRHIVNLSQSVFELTKKLSKLEKHNIQLNKKIEELSGIKLSAKLLIRNVKSKFKIPLR